MTLAAIGAGASGPLAERFLDDALRAIAAHPAWRAVAKSGRYANPAVGSLWPYRFVNAVVLVETQLAPEALLTELFALERRFGRVRSVRWGPRSLDLDLLWVEGVRRSSARLVVPHPRLRERAFALVPLEEAFARAGRPCPLDLRRAAAARVTGARLARLPPPFAPTPLSPRAWVAHRPGSAP